MTSMTTRGRVTCALATAMIAVFLLGSFQPSQARTRAGGGSDRGLVAAGRQTPVSALDKDDEACDSEDSADAWLRTMTKPDARSIVWTGGACQLTQDTDPGVAVRSWAWCAQAHIKLVQPWEAGDEPMIEIWFTEPTDGHAGAPFAFRGLIKATLEGGPVIVRDRHSFVASWRARFPANAASQDCENQDQ